MIRARNRRHGMVGEDARGGRGRQRADPLRRGRDAHGVAGGEGVRGGAAADDWSTSYEALLADTSIDAVVLATPHSLHAAQTIAAAKVGKHVFCEKPFALHKADAEAAVAATQQAGVTLGLGYNRRFHPEMTKLRQQIQSGELGTILHFEATMTFPNALFLKPDAWRADKEETPCGGLTPMGVHAIDGMIDLGRRDRAGLLSELPPRGAGRERRHDVDAVSHEERRVGLSRDDHGDRARLQLPGVWLEGLGAARRDDARRRAPRPRSAARASSAPASFNRSRGRRRCGTRRASTSRARASRRLRPRPPAARRISFRRAR